MHSTLRHSLGQDLPAGWGIAGAAVMQEDLIQGPLQRSTVRLLQQLHYSVSPEALGARQMQLQPIVCLDLQTGQLQQAVQHEGLVYLCLTLCQLVTEA